MMAVALKENFLILNFLDFQNNLTVENVALQADFSAKTFKIKDAQRRHFGSDAVALKQIRNIALAVFYPQPYKVILIFNSALAAGYYGSVVLNREKPQQPIDEAELDNLISQALWEAFDKNRIIAVKQINCNDLEILLCDVRIYDIQIDSHSFIHILGQTGKTVKINFSQTLAKRSFFKDLISVLPKRAKTVFNVEAGAIIAHLLSRCNFGKSHRTAKKNSKEFLFAKVSDNRTDIFSSKNNQINFLDYFSWGANPLYKNIADNLRINALLARDIIEKLPISQTSLSFQRKLNKIIYGEVIVLFRGLKSFLDRTKILSVFLHCNILLPLKFNKISNKIITLVDSEKIMRFFGFNCVDNAKKNTTINHLDIATVAALIEFYFLPKEDFVDEDITNRGLFQYLAKRRMKWLIP